MALSAVACFGAVGAVRGTAAGAHRYLVESRSVASAVRQVWSFAAPEVSAAEAEAHAIREALRRGVDRWNAAGMPVL